MTYPSSGGGWSTPTNAGSPDIKDRAADTVDAGKQGATEVAQTAADKARDVTEEATRQARDLLGEVRGELTQQAGNQHQKLVSGLRSLSEEIGSMAHGDEQGGIATELVSQAGERVHSVADWLESRQPGDLLTEVRGFARNRPGTFLLGAALAGVVAGRMTRGVVAAHSSADASPPPVGSDAESTALPIAPTAPSAATPTRDLLAPPTAPESYPTEVMTHPEPASAGSGYRSTGDRGNYGTETYQGGPR
ncbi:MAG: hypothetical protein QOE97_28 [Pseudonocardiales bacterium]|jgi:hypothetical protein|nr:hypothetical protein [Pseudonocardiales bacterium]